MLRFRSWIKNNKRAIKECLRRRGNRGIELTAPLSLSSVLVVCRLDKNFDDFAQKVGGKSAETLFIRALQYASLNDGLLGTIRVEKRRFATVVLSRPWDTVRVSQGVRAYEALLSSGICVPFDGDWGALWDANKTAFPTAVRGAVSTAPSLKPDALTSPTPPGRGGGRGSPKAPEMHPALERPANGKTMAEWMAEGGLRS